MIVNGKEVTDTEERENLTFDREFHEWAASKKIELHDKLSEVMPEATRELTKGQRVSVINGYGYLFHGYTIMGFGKPDKYGRCVFLNWDCWWFDVCPEDIVPE